MILSYVQIFFDYVCCVVVIHCLRIFAKYFMGFQEHAEKELEI